MTTTPNCGSDQPMITFQAVLVDPFESLLAQAHSAMADRMGKKGAIGGGGANGTES